MGDKKETSLDDLSDILTDLKSTITSAKDGPTAVANLNEKLIKDNFRLREILRDLNTKLETAGKLPDGARVIEKADAEMFDKFKALGMKPEDVSGVLVDYDNMRVGQQARDAGDALNWKHPVLKNLIETQGLDVEMKEVEIDGEDGKKVKKPMPFVTTEDNKSVRLDEFEPLKQFHPSLVKDDSEVAGAGGRNTHGVRMPLQVGSQGSNGSRNGTNSGKKGGELTQVVSTTLSSKYPGPTQMQKGKGQEQDQKAKK
jgi:hypothetical protein